MSITDRVVDLFDDIMENLDGILFMLLLASFIVIPVVLGILA